MTQLPQTSDFYKIQLPAYYRKRRYACNPAVETEVIFSTYFYESLVKVLKGLFNFLFKKVIYQTHIQISETIQKRSNLSLELQSLLHSFHSRNFKHILWVKGKIMSVKYNIDSSSHGEEKIFVAINMFGGHFVMYANSESLL